MTQNITTYYIPQNLNITKGKIYCFYINKVTNLDIKSIIPNKEMTLNGILQPNKELNPKTPPTSNISLSQEDYTSILSLANISTKLYNQSQELVKKLTRERNIK